MAPLTRVTSTQLAAMAGFVDRRLTYVQAGAGLMLPSGRRARV